MTEGPSIDILEGQEARLVFPAFGEDTAWAIGTALVAVARAAAAPVVIDIRTPDRTLFHAALPGSTPDNDHWARRKSAVVLRYHHSSLLVGVRLSHRGATLEPSGGIDPMEFAAHGGSFPVRVKGTGVVAAITVSGLASEDDHAMIVAVLEDHLG